MFLELDGDAVSDSASGLPEDWDRVLGWDNGMAVPPSGSSPFHVWQEDPSPQSVFLGTGNNNQDDLADWSWTDAAVVGKSDIAHAFLSVWPDELAFGADRPTANDSWYVCFWLLQGTLSADPGGGFTGTHVVGDILVSVDAYIFSSPPDVRVYRWVGDGSGSDGNLDEVTSAFLDSELAARKNEDVACSPWPYTPLFPPTCRPGCVSCVPVQAFLEGFLSLDVLGLRCFQTAVVATRNAEPIGAYLLDFVLLDLRSQPSVTVDRVCEGDPLCASVTGGVPPYMYSWNTGETTSCLAAPAPGVHVVTVTDANLCSRTAYGTVIPALICPEACFEFRAVVTDLSDFYGLLDRAISVGDTIEGFYSYDPSTPDADANPAVGDYEHFVSPYGIEVDAGGFQFRTDPANVDFLVELANDVSSTDSYLLRSYNNLPLSNGMLVDQVSWQLDDPTGTALSGDALPTSAPVLGEWQSVLGMRLEGTDPGDPGHAYLVEADVVSITRCASQQVGVLPGEVEFPSALRLPAPNPSVGEVRLAFAVAVEGRVRLDIVGLDGRLVRTLIDAVLPPGERSATWDGRDASGQRVAAGVYFERLSVNGSSYSRRLVRLD